MPNSCQCVSCSWSWARWWLCHRNLQRDARPIVTFPAALRPVTNYTAWWQGQKGGGVNNLPRVVTQLRSDRESHPTTSWTHVRHPTVQLSRYYRRSRVENHNTSLYSTFYGGWKRDTARICCCAVAAGRRTCSSRYYLPAGPTAAKPPHDAAAVYSWDRQTNRQTDTVPLRIPCRVLCEQCQMQIWL